MEEADTSRVDVDAQSSPTADGVDSPPDPRRWLTLGIVVATAVLLSIDTSVLNVSIPTMLRELDTTVPALQWVITGYSLTIASLLIIGGRLGDLFGHRKMFVVGMTLFGVGSLIASMSDSVSHLILGEAIIEGLGAALLLPATLAILSTTFSGRERITAFTVWGATGGAGAAFGPVLGGFLTTHYSWRWAFRINVVVAPIAAIGALIVMRNRQRAAKTPIDVPGAALVAVSMFLFVFALSESGQYGWFVPLEPFTIGGTELWPTSMPFSIGFASLIVSGSVMFAFVRLQQWKKRRERDSLFDLALLNIRSFRYGLITTMIIAMGQLGLMFALPLYLQNVAHLSAEKNGLWMLPMGIAVIFGAQLSGRLSRRIHVLTILRVGVVGEAVALLLVIWSVRPDVTFWHVLPGLVSFGVAIGAVSSNLTAVVMADVPRAKSGVGGAATATSRHIGAAFGAAMLGSLITVQTTGHAVRAFESAGLPPGLREQAIAGVRELGPNFQMPAGASPTDAATIERAFNRALQVGERFGLLFAAGVVLLGAIAVGLIPRRSDAAPSLSATEELVEKLDPLQTVDVDPARV
jgi:MFS family permease